MTLLTDARGQPLSGATPAALAHYERALAASLTWRGGADALLDAALVDAPAFTMAHVLKAWLLAGSRDVRRVRAARPWLEAAAAEPAGEHERLHLAAIGRVLADDYEGAAALLGRALEARPHDVLALSVACGIDHLGGQAERQRARIEHVLPAWPGDLPGWHSVRAMHAFALAECGHDAQAEQSAHAALALDEGDARAHHAMAHVFEMTDRPAAGARWMNANRQHWSHGTAVAAHCWWHLALFRLAQGDDAAALAVYDERLRAADPGDLSALFDAAALLWRLRLRGVDGGARWAALADAWAPHVDDAFCIFNDLHAMLAFVGAHDWARAQALERTLLRSRQRPTRHGESARQLGLAACRGVMAFGRGDLPQAITLLASLPAQAHRLGGSHAQRDVMHLTLLAALEAVRRPARRAARVVSAGEATLDTRLPLARSAIAMPLA